MKGDRKVNYKNCCSECHWFGIDYEKMIRYCYVSGERQVLNKTLDDIDEGCSNFYDFLIAGEDEYDVSVH